MKGREQEEEETDTENARKAIAEGTGLVPARMQRKTMEELARQTRRLTIRLASVANRCFWVSAAELTVHILTDGDCLQNHNNVIMFTRQLQWAMLQCKKHLNSETVECEPKQALQHVQTVTVYVPNDEQDAQGGDGDDAQGGDVTITKIEACTHNTNASDDYAHRGTKLRSMPSHSHRMYVRHIPMPSRVKARSPTIAQELRGGGDAQQHQRPDHR